MPFIPTPGCQQVALHFTQDGQHVANVFNVNYPGVSTTIQEDIADAFDTWWSTNYNTLVSSAVTLNEIVVTDMSTSTGPQFTKTDITSPSGQLNGTAMPNNSALAATFLTGLRGRSYRGRMYIPGIASNILVSENTVKAISITDIITMLQALVTLLTAIDVVLSVLSKFHALAPRTEGVLTPVDGFRVDNTLDSQRRRLPGRGT